VNWHHLFQGFKLTEATGIADVRNRDYSATLGRFIEIDPIGFASGGINLYRFAWNAPNSYNDPFGLKEIQGINIDHSFCGCQAELQSALDWAKKMQSEYKKCGEAKAQSGKPLYNTGKDIEKCVDDSLAKQGITTSVGGTTDSSGNVNVNPQPGKCGPLLTKGTELHEGVHSSHVKELLKKFGKWDPKTKTYIETKEYLEIYNSAKDWWTDDFNSYGAEQPFYNDVIKELNMLNCCKPLVPGGGGTNSPSGPKPPSK
jgi:RHS repeat-associated protein